VLAPPAVEVRRTLHQVRPDEVFALLGSAAAGVCFSYALYYVLLPLSGLLGFLVLSYVLFVGIYALVTSLTADRPQVIDKIAQVVVASVAGFMILVLAVIVSFTFKRGFAALRHLNFFTHDLSRAGPLQPLTQGGVWHAIVGTVIMITIALVITIPIGLVAALYLSESRGAFSRLVRTIVEAMTALPSVIAGLFVYAVIITLAVPLDRAKEQYKQTGHKPFSWYLLEPLEKIGITHKSGFAAALALSVMMLPIIIRAADVVLRLVPGTLKEAAAALGASRWRIAWQVVMPTSRSGLMTAIILGAARGIGETSPVLLTAGYSRATNADPTQNPMVSLPLATFQLTRSSEPTEIARGFGAAAVLMMIVLVLFVIARVLGGRAPGELSPRGRQRVARGSRSDLERMMYTREQAAAAAAARFPSNGRHL
jgi:phosphate transport system permease protein